MISRVSQHCLLVAYFAGSRGRLGKCCPSKLPQLCSGSLLLSLHNVTQHVQVSAVGIADFTHFLNLCAVVLLLHSTTNNLQIYIYIFFHPFCNAYNINSGIGVTGQFVWNSIAVAFKSNVFWKSACFISCKFSELETFEM